MVVWVYVDKCFCADRVLPILFFLSGGFVISDGLILTDPRWEIPKNPVGVEGSFFFVSVSQFLKLGLANLGQQS